jgi:hypothetical protein
VKDNLALTLGGIASLLAGITHILIIFGGPNWYRFFGAGESMAQMAEAGNIQAAIITSGIAFMLTVWGLYALSGTGLIGRLPLLNIALVLITFVYLTRAIAGFILPFVTTHPAVTQNSVTFWLTSSTICLVIGLLHLFGIIRLFQDNY